MNLEQLNVVELSSEEMVETTGGRYIMPITDKDVWDEVFVVRNPLFY
ncbi:hypothetical protein LZF95_11005 [Algoriphagus sp. AGSA1]|nr:hypothetical protein [Algoriphagus sp. AGSA1]MCE7055205.1 hypothetical protein [Algoriphagus sp. AGSA1]